MQMQELRNLDPQNDIVIVEILDLNAFTDDPEDKTEPPLVSKSTDGKLDDNFLEIYYEFIKWLEFSFDVHESS